MSTPTNPSPAADGEVVTLALARDVALPRGAGTLALVTLDNGRDHTRPTTLGPGGLASLEQTLLTQRERAGRGEITAIALTGKPYVFCAGADLGVFSSAGTGQGADGPASMVRRGHEVFALLHDAGVPTFAFVNGPAMGGGLEMALHCDVRTVSTGARALALPEAALGLVPGWGGSWLLPQLVGVERTLEVIVRNALSQQRALTPAQARDLGLADALFDPADFLERSIEFAADVLAGAIVPTRREVDRDEGRWTAAVAAARAFVDLKVHGSAPAPYEALDLVAAARTATRDEAFAAERAALLRLVGSQEFHASAYAFDLVRSRAKRPVGAPPAHLARPVGAVAVVGAGLMASQLALLFVQRLQVPVTLLDLDEERAARGVAWVHDELTALAARRKITPDAANRYRALVTGTTDHGALADADLVIEAVFEELEVKRQVFTALEQHVSDTCVLMTNTSSLSVTAMAEGLRRPERVVGFHFFNPVAVLPLVEVVRTPRTDEATLATAFALGRTLRKSCVLVADSPAFVVNRLLLRFMDEVMATIDEGTDAEVADAAVAPLGLPMSPLQLLQLVGAAVARHVAATLHEAFPDRYAVPTVLDRVLAAAPEVLVAPDAQGAPRVTDEVRALLAGGTSPSAPDEVLRRAVDALAEEARLMLDEGVVAGPQELDLCMILGAGWPFHQGGLTPYLDRSGAAEKVTGRRFLPPGVATLPA